MRLAPGLLASVTIWIGSALAVPMITIQPPTLTATPGSSFSVFVDLSSASDLYAYQFDASFDPTILAALGVTEGPFLPSGGATFFVPGSIDNAAGSIAFSADTLVGPIPGVSGNGIVAAIEFQALALGSTAIDLSGVTLLDSSLIADASFTAVGGLVSVVSATGVPEPSSIVIVGIGIFGLATIRLWIASRRR